MMPNRTACLFGLLLSAMALLFLNTAGLWWDLGTYFFSQPITLRFASIVCVTTFFSSAFLWQLKFRTRNIEPNIELLKECVLLGVASTFIAFLVVAGAMVVGSGLHTAAATDYEDLRILFLLLLAMSFGGVILVLIPAVPYGAIGGAIFWIFFRWDRTVKRRAA